MRILPLAFIALAFAGCASTKVDFQALHTAEAKCIDAKVAGGSYREQALCINAAQNLHDPNEPNADLLSEEQALRLVLADRLDSAKITLAEAKLEMSHLKTSLNSEAERRKQGREATAAAILASMPRQPPPAPAPVIFTPTPIPRTVDCMSMVTGSLISTQCQ